jgi:anti-sigma B factor antagonist
MKMSQHETGNVTVLEPKGKIMIGAGDVKLRSSIEDALEGGNRNILVNLERVSKMDSSGLGELVAGYNAASEHGGTVKLANLPSALYNVLGATRLLSVFEVFDDIDEAVRSFESSTAT